MPGWPVQGQPTKAPTGELCVEPFKPKAITRIPETPAMAHLSSHVCCLAATAYVHLYGSQARLKLVERISALEAVRAALLGGLPKATQAHVLRRQRSAATEPGAEKWVFPSPIYDERGFREEVQREEAAQVAAGGRKAKP